MKVRFWIEVLFQVSLEDAMDAIPMQLDIQKRQYFGGSQINNYICISET